MDNDRFNRVEEKIDKLVEQVSGLNATVSASHSNTERRLEAIEKIIPPVQNHISMVQGAAKLSGMIVLGLGGLAGLVEFLVYVGGSVLK